MAAITLPFNMDFQQPVLINTEEREWLASPHPGVERIPLAREDAEQGHATSIVRYHPGASFHAHNHPGGEEILVLSGIFSDETGDFPAGSYFRNPMGFRHAPFSKAGCTILVKLHQFQSSDDQRLSIQTDAADWSMLTPDSQQLPLHHFQHERVQMLRFSDASECLLEDLHYGIEVYVLAGTLSVLFEDNVANDLVAGCWWRSPLSSTQAMSSEVRLRAEKNTLAWVKSGHFRS